MTCVDEIVLAIDKYREKNRSLRDLANDSGVSYSTIKRLYGRETSSAQWSTFYGLSSVLFSVPERNKLIREYYPNYSNTIANSLGSSSESASAIGESVLPFLVREPHNRVFNMAATSNGVTIDKIVKLCGEAGRRAAEEMVDESVLYWSNEKIYYKDTPWIPRQNPDDYLNQIRLSTIHFDRKLLGQFSRLAHITGSLNDDGVKIFYHKLSKFISEVIDITDAKEYEGDLKVFLDLLSSPYDCDDINDNLLRGFINE